MVRINKELIRIIVINNVYIKLDNDNITCIDWFSPNLYNRLTYIIIISTIMIKF